uniref:Uncharacterized protein n=1 Tax=Oryza sativa subsp. japonica TaxID=39947 RepID=Q6K872_ORYSJ|nr:hypothetical protein [Oryza sativa Japonica Group]
MDVELNEGDGGVRGGPAEQEKCVLPLPHHLDSLPRRCPHRTGQVGHRWRWRMGQVGRRPWPPPLAAAPPALASTDGRWKGRSSDGWGEVEEDAGGREALMEGIEKRQRKSGGEQAVVDG